MAAMTDISVDRSSPVPLYYQLAQQLQRLIERGDLAVGTRLWNEADLAGRLGLSRPTVRQAVQHLVHAGMLERRRGVGTHITARRLRRPVQLSSLHDDLLESGRRPRTQTLDMSTVPASATVAERVGGVPGEEVVRIERLRFADDEPLALLVNYLPAGLVEVSANELEHVGLYERLRTAGLKPASAHQTIGACRATARVSRLLGEPRGAPLLTMTRTTRDPRGRVLEYGSHRYRASLYTFEIDL